MNCLIIYQKSDGTQFIRAYEHNQYRKIGDKTNMGWKVLNILYEFDGNYYQYNKFMRLVREKIKKQSNKKRITKKFKKAIYHFASLKLRKLYKNIYS